MRIAVVSSTTIPATLPDDPLRFTTYGSEVENAVLVKGLADAGHEIEWYAPIGSTTFHENPRIHYHPIMNSKGTHLQNELLEVISYDGSKTTDLLENHFLLDMSKQAHVSEELELYSGFKKSIQYRSGYQDFSFPMRIAPRFVTHCEAFRQNFLKNGYNADVARFGLSDFWHSESQDGASYKDGTTPETHMLQILWQLEPNYFLFPHRPVPDKGIDTVLRLARAFPDETFVISTAAIFEDHKREIARVKAEAVGFQNIKFIDCPQNKRYHYYRRALMRNARAVLSLFDNHSGYLDTGGLVSFEAIRCGTPLIVTRSEASEEMLGELQDKGVEFVCGFDGARLAIRSKAWETRPNVDRNWMSISDYVNDYLGIIKKYS